MMVRGFPITGTAITRWQPVGGCGICGEYEGIHPRCWWIWLTEERTVYGYNDGEQQLEPDEPYSSRWWIVRMTLRNWIRPRYWFDR